MARTYVVKKGDTLAKIAKAQLGDAKLYPQIAELNGLRDPGMISVGQQLEIPLRRDLEPPAPVVPIVPAGSATLRPPHGLSAVLAEFGDIYTYLRDDGSLDPQWEKDQLSRAQLPFAIPLSWDRTKQVTSLYCHRKLAPVFADVFGELRRRNLQGRVETFGGCFNFRAKRSGSKLSTHAWGIAIDLNPETNPMGKPGRMPESVVQTFRDFGFTWGGDWSGKNRDPMHFQYCSGY